jgi:hypothetical protein
MWATDITHPFLEGGDTMNNDILMLLFEGGLFLISLLTFIVLLIKAIKNSSSHSQLDTTIFIKNFSDTSCLSN